MVREFFRVGAKVEVRCPHWSLSSTPEVCISSTLGLYTMPQCLAFDIFYGVLVSGPHACTLNTLPSAPSFWSLYLFKTSLNISSFI